MKKCIILVMVVSTIRLPLCAQHTTEPDNFFQAPPSSFAINFAIDLDKGNKMAFGLTDTLAIPAIASIDSLLQVFSRDVDQLKKSLGDGIGTRRVDYLVSPSGINKIRIRQNKAGETYVSQDGKISLLKVGQDSIFITGRFAHKTTDSQAVQVEYYQVRFFLNDITDLKSLVPGAVQAKLNAFIASGKLTELQPAAAESWVGRRDPHDTRMRKARLSYTTGLTISDDVDFTRIVAFSGSAALQNYKHYFVPSFSATVELISREWISQRSIGLRAEGLFSFQKNSAGNLKTNTSYLVGVFYERKRMTGMSPDWQVPFYLSLGYLVRSLGTIIEPRTIRLGIGRAILLNGSTRIEPVIYFRELFKDVSPGIMFIQNF